MSTILTVILLCAAATAGPDCDRATALDVVVQPADSVAGCQLQGQATAARVFSEEAGAGRYVMVRCERRKG